MSIAAPIVVLFCVLAVGGWVAAALDSLTFALIARQPLSPATVALPWRRRSEEHTSELQSLMRISYAVFCLTKKKKKNPATLLLHFPVYASCNTLYLKIICYTHHITYTI